jgi:hypothetical protein
MVGLMKDGEDGSETREVEGQLKGGCIESPFIFLGRRGAGDVIGRSRLVSETARQSIDGKLPNEVALNDDRGTTLTGESGDEDGEGSESEGESVHVVVGDDSADSEFCVEVLSLCL